MQAWYVAVEGVVIPRGACWVTYNVYGMEEMVPSGLEVRESAVYGRGLFSTKGLAPGTEVLVSQPFLHVVSSPSRGTVCDQCLMSSE